MLNVTAVSEKNQTKYSVQVRSILGNIVHYIHNMFCEGGVIYNYFSFFQINLNLGFLDNETFINGAPLKSTGVTRMTCPALLCMHCLVFFFIY